MTMQLTQGAGPAGTPGFMCKRYVETGGSVDLSPSCIEFSHSRAVPHLHTMIFVIVKGHCSQTDTNCVFNKYLDLKMVFALVGAEFGGVRIACTCALHALPFPVSGGLRLCSGSSWAGGDCARVPRPSKIILLG